MMTETQDQLEDVARRYAVRTTPFLERQMADLPDDSPLARQFRPSAKELLTTPDELADPIGDSLKSPIAGIVHRYPDRVLLKPVHVCAAYCRFCFRREVVGPGSESLNDEELEKALSYIADHAELREVILTGGDPLLLSPRRLHYILGALDSMDHIELIRFHTRLPIHDPKRITPDLVTALTSLDRATVWVAIHVNHADEFAPEVCHAVASLSKAGIPLVSQTVLLKDVNNNVDALEALFRACLRNRIKPYYLHHPDMAKGTSHFRLEIEEGRALLKALRGRLTGIALPHYILDRPGALGKVPLGPSWPEDWAEDWADSQA